MFDFAVEAKSEKSLFESQKHFDFAVIGGGPAGMNAALYAIRKGLSVAVFSLEIGGQLHNTSEVDNYIGIENTTGGKLSEAFHHHVLELGVPIKTGHLVTKLEKPDDFHITLDNNEVYTAKTVLYATGGAPRKLGVPGEEEFANKGVSYCTTCDAPFFKNEHVIVAGGGNSAAESVVDLAAWASKITVVHRSQWRADQIILDQFKNIEGLEINLETQILEIFGDTKMRGVRVLDKPSGEERVIEADGMFVEIGNIPKSALLKGLVDLNEQGEVIVSRDQETSLPGLYAAGDVTTQPYKQIIISASEGAVAALAATQYLMHRKN